jgi:hypothetical protein
MQTGNSSWRKIGRKENVYEVHRGTIVFNVSRKRRVWQHASIRPASRSFLIICSGLCRFRFIENLLVQSSARDSDNT